MPVTVKSFTGVIASQTITVPSGVVAGDLLVLCAGNYNYVMSNPSGWTTAASTTGTGTYTDYGAVYYKIATGTESGTSIPNGASNYSLSGMTLMVITGHSAISPLTVTATPVNGSTNMTANSVAPSTAVRRFAFFTGMDGSGNPLSMTTPSGWSLVDSQGQTQYHRTLLVSNNTTQESSGTLAAVTSTASDSVGGVAFNIAIAVGNQSPTLSNIVPITNTGWDNRTAPVVASWTYADAESNAQTQFEVGYREVGLKGNVAGTATNFAYTGSQQTYVVPAGVTQVKIESWGASGYNPGNTANGRGAYASGWLAVTPGETLYVYVGNTGALSAGGYNGGGAGAPTSAGGGGGGASDVRQTSNALANRKIVAAGGGGTYGTSGSTGGAGGTTTGDNGHATQTTGKGATQSAGGNLSGALGLGGAGNNDGGGGGGGYYGGGGGNGTTGAVGGGGGSSYITGLTNTAWYPGTDATYGRAGAGQVKISPIIYDFVDYTTTTGTTATSVSFPTGTFTDGTEYEMRIRVNDGVGGWSPYYTSYFTSGPSVWNYESIVSSSTQGGSFPLSLPTFGTFENSTDIVDGQWGSTTAFGAYVSSTYARVSTKASTGTYSLEVTMPTTTTTPTWVQCGVTVEIGVLYEVSVDVWVPTGQSPVEIDAAFQNTSSQRSTVTNAWQTIKGVFVSTTTNAFPGVKSVSATTSGQKFWIDNFTVKRLPGLTGGNYEVQVKTSDGVFGPWSASSSFTVNNPPVASAVDVNPKRVGGNVNVTWTYTDAESNAQTKYQIRRRKEL